MKSLSLLLVALSLHFSANASPAIPAEIELRTCLEARTSLDDRKKLVRWVFVVLSTHPDVQGISNLPGDARDRTLKSMADVVVRLLRKDCVSQNQATMQEQGVRDNRAAYGFFAELAIQELTGNPELAGSLVQFERYMTFEKLEEVAPTK